MKCAVDHKMGSEAISKSVLRITAGLSNTIPIFAADATVSYPLTNMGQLRDPQAKIYAYRLSTKD